jgi:hypothetical protein
VTNSLSRALLASGLGLAALAAPAIAQDAKPAATGGLFDGIKLSGSINAGFMANPARPNTGLNFGHLFTDRANSGALNQILLTAEKKLDLENPGFQWGFKLQGMYGTDARFTQFLGVFNNVARNSRYQPDIVEANVQFRLPVF